MIMFCNLQVEYIAIYRTNSTSRVNVSVAVGRRVVTEYKLFRLPRAPRINPEYSTIGSEQSSLEKTGNTDYAGQAKESLLKRQSQTQKRRKGASFSTAGWGGATLPLLDLMAH